MSFPIHAAIVFINSLIEKGDTIHVRVEDARLRKWFGPRAKEKLQGAGSIKRDSKIWDDYLKDMNCLSEGRLTYEMIHPIKGGTKINSKLFKQITGITERTSEHARDAYLLIHEYKKPQLKAVS